MEKNNHLDKKPQMCSKPLERELPDFVHVRVQSQFNTKVYRKDEPNQVLNT